MSPVAIDGVFGGQRGRSMDMLSKPDKLQPLVGFPTDDASNTDDSSQDASLRNTPRQFRHSSAWEHHADAAVSPIFAARGPAPMFFRERAFTDSALPADDNALAPSLVFIRSTGTGSRADLTTPNIVVSEPSPEYEASAPIPDGDTESTPRPRQEMQFHETTILASPELTPTMPSTAPTTSTSSTQSALQREIQDRRSPASPMTAPLPPPFTVSTERGLRLSPSIITRQPMPLLNLPILPPQTPAAQPEARPQIPTTKILLLVIQMRMKTGKMERD
ncbi:hypothetical protein BJ138DRAFT_820975 [Hygrophoropsis aurantiaca]|uniref:Uncharacterized protein n=1 Tax=Hygrophoropsis aurantiaca TaxID=72124 RepID=A0ACB8AGB6_9AGAM|nr:hypothetical protein BJ138DRAFT_820975 [Hygrophoropsis aurantiaca]